MIRLPVLLLLCCAVAAPAADGILARIDASNSSVTVGDRVRVTVSITAPGAKLIKLAEPQADEERFAILDDTVADEIDAAGAPHLVRRFTLVPFTVGDIEIAPLEYEVITADGQSSIGSTPTLALQVLSIAADGNGPTEAKRFKDIVRPPAEDNSLLIAGASAVLLLASAALWRISRRRRPASVDALMRLSPAERALHNLDQLNNAQLIENGEVGAFSTTLSAILRRYFGLRYHILALEMTSTELKDRLKQLHKDDEPVHNVLAGVLNFCDLVKFARHEPQPVDGAESVESARAVINGTREDVVKAMADAVSGGRGR